MTPPEDIASLHREAEHALRTGRLREAHRLCLALLERDRHCADAWYFSAVIAAHNAQHAKAVTLLTRALALAPDNTEYRAELGKQLLALHRPREALATARATLALEPRSIATLNALGTVFSHCGEHADALSCFRAAAAGLAKRGEALGAGFTAELHFNLAASLQFAGDVAQAARAYERAIAARPDFYRAYAALASLPRDASGRENLLPRLDALRSAATGAVDRLYLGHAIAAEQEACGAYGESLAALRWAKQARAAEVAYDSAGDAALFAAIRRHFDRAYCSAATPAGAGSEEPIFVVGMPRTGTTLVEQILGSHSRVFAAGELQAFPQAVKRLAATATASPLDIETLAAAATLEPAALGGAYLDSTRPRTGRTAHFVDKLPHNFLYLGLIRRALPAAKIICLRRDPMDTCLSNYRQLFATRFSYYHYNYDLLDCGRYYIEFDRLMQHWRTAMPGQILEVQYEALVAEPEQVVRAMLAHCGLEWEDGCLEFHRHQRSVATPSAAQVREPIHGNAVGRWRRYGDAVQPLYRLLQAGGGYS